MDFIVGKYVYFTEALPPISLARASCCQVEVVSLPGPSRPGDGGLGMGDWGWGTGDGGLGMGDWGWGTGDGGLGMGDWG